MSFLDTIKFAELSNVLEMSSKADNTKKRQKIYKQFFEQIEKLKNDFKAKNPRSDVSLYPLLRIIFANDDTERIYRMQDFRLRKILINVMQLKGTKDGTLLETCNEDFLADNVFEVVKSRSSTKTGSISIADFDRCLTRIVEDAEATFQYFYQKSSARDLKWLVKIVLKNMKLKIPDKFILDNYHPLANALFERYQHLSKVCEFVEQGIAEKALKEIRPFLPIRAMLAQKLTSETNKKFLAYNEIYTETKMDGERFQLHIEDGVYKYYSRKAHDYSEGFNKLITPRLKFKSVVHSLVLDGEMLLYNKEKDRFTTKGENTNLDVKRMHYETETMRPCYCPFDVLYLNGTCYMDLPYRDRNKILENLIIDEKGVIMRVKSTKMRDSEHIAELLNEAINNDEEGLILKKGDSVYAPGERNAGWYKMKPDYLDDNVVKDFDCVIIGGTFQNEHTRDYISKYTLGALRKNEDGTFDAFAIGEAIHGVTVTKRMELSLALTSVGIDYKGQDEVSYEKGKIFFGGKNRPHIVIPPHRSKILEIRASELAQSSDHFTKYSFRFPRIQEIRTDKIWDESLMLDEFEDLYKNADGQVVKITLRNVHRDDVASPPKKKAATRGTFKDALKKYCDNPQIEVKALDNILAGIEFCVLSNTKKDELTTLLKLHSASITAFPRINKTFAIIADDLKSRNVLNYTRKAKEEENHNIMKAEWIETNLPPTEALDEIPKIVPRDFLFMKDNLKIKFAGKFDKFGDSYVESFKSEESLMEFIKDMKDVNEEEMSEFQSELGVDSFNFFRGSSANFIHPKSKVSSLKIAEHIFKTRGGNIEKNSQMIVIDKRFYEEKIEEGMISHQWIIDSNKAGMKLNLNDYKI